MWFEVIVCTGQRVAKRLYISDCLLLTKTIQRVWYINIEDRSGLFKRTCVLRYFYSYKRAWSSSKESRFEDRKSNGRPVSGGASEERGS